ncbi:YhjD/YihY/BrkB family envelope integrity protein [Streptomyces sp. NPDC058964]|uniref:YhjD/YihY/BrkB family envelope integrity protein n=1 Tax=Streptomyces sp. NPDC058964 TaxID=3346681 RepID=UPI00369A3969
MRVVNRFQKIVGFDRSMALASSALTALIPLMVVIGAVLGAFLHDEDIAQRIISRYGLNGEGAKAVEALFTPTGGTSTSVGVFGVLFLTISALSFERAAQRLFEQNWELKPLSVRNTRNGLWWILCLGVYLTVGGWLYSVLGQSKLALVPTMCDVPVTAVFLLWSGRLLSASRIGLKDLLPFAVTASVLAGVYSVGATVYLPRLFNSYASRYGSVGAVFAMISGLFGAMLVIVGSAALGREVRDELVRISRGQRPSEREVRRQWDNVVEQTRSRWRTAREQISHRRTKEEEE